MQTLVFANAAKPGVGRYLEEVKAILSSRGCACTAVYDPAGAFAAYPNGCDLCVVLGGDGTMLAAAGWASRTGTPVVGINLGRLGYMSELEPEDIPLLSRVVGSDLPAENRMMLTAEVYREGCLLASYTALNEIVVSRGTVTRLIDLELRCRGENVGSYRADGIIISTPTGSTAYAMSAGGPIIDPSLELITVSAVCPHGSTFSGSMVFSPSSELEISVSSKYNGDIYITADGRESAELFYEDTVRVKRADTVFRLIHPKQNSFYKTLSKKIKEK